MTCLVETREQLRNARRALLAHPEIAGASLSSPREGTREEWTIEAALLADGLGPEQLTTAARHQLTVRRVEQRSPDETRVLFAPV